MMRRFCVVSGHRGDGGGEPLAGKSFAGEHAVADGGNGGISPQTQKEHVRIGFLPPLRPV